MQLYLTLYTTLFFNYFIHNFISNHFILQFCKFNSNYFTETREIGAL